MDELEVKLANALRDILIPYDRGIVISVLSKTLAAASVTWLFDLGDMHDLPETKELMLKLLEKDIDGVAQAANDQTFRGN